VRAQRHDEGLVRKNLAAKIRVHELAKELGLTNKEALDLSLALGIGVKTHSSGIEEAQADRVRRRAQRDGLVRAEQPAEPKAEPVKASKATKATKSASSKPKADKKPEAEPKTDDGEAADKPAKAAAAEEPAKAEAVKETAAKAEAKADAVEPQADSSDDEQPERAAPTPPPPPAASRPSAPAPKPPMPRPSTPPPPPPPAPLLDETPAAAERPARLVTSSGSDHPPRPARRPEVPAAAPAPAPAQQPAAHAPRPPEPQASGGQSRAPRPPRPSAPPAGRPASGGGSADAQRSPVSSSGKAIPPPPGPPVSTTGKPIPPPPGMGGRGAPPNRPGPGRVGVGGRGRTGPPSGGGSGGGSRPFGGGGGPGSGPGRPGGGPGMGGGPGGGPGGGRPGGGPRGGQRPPRRRGRRRRNREELQPMEVPSYTPASAPVPEGVIVVERASTPQDLGPKLNRTASDVVRFLMQQGEMVTATQSLSDDMIELFAAEIGAEIRLVDPGEEQEVELQSQLGLEELLEDDPEERQARPPVITVMGHVDHGKTKLLDRIRNANVIEGEAGGITQHIGAYQTEKNGRHITFIDTPGHAAFTAMRARGAQATDIVILVVAADDGVMPQTVEALNHARAAQVPIVVAINKIDRENANPDRVKQQLSELDLIPTDWGGDVEMVPISAREGIGIDELLETLLLVADVQEPPIAASYEGRAAGVVLEARLDVGRGPVATVLVQRGTLRVGDPLVAGAAWGRVRALINDRGTTVREAGPSMPVQVLGLSDVADAGDQFVVAPDEKVARSVASTREHWHRLANLGREAAVSMGGGAKLEDLFEQIRQGEKATLNLILKADVIGSLEALTEALRKLEREDVTLAFIDRAVGGITQNDVQFAAASNATIIGFNVRPDRKSRELAQNEDVEIRTYEIIYQVLEDIENAMVGMLAPEFEEVVTGEAEVREIFSVPRVGKVAGCYVTSGVITRGSKVRFLREGTIIWKGTVSSLKRFKEDAREVASGFECGIGLSDFQDLKQGDLIETFDEREIPRS
jgi:translation initiation factor IF-2